MTLKLAFRNIKRQTSTYVIYFITVMFTAALMFAVNNVLFSPDLYEYARDDADLRDGITRLVTPFIVAVVCIVCFIVCYATSYLLKRRRREFGTYMLLGMKKRRVLAVFVTENAVVGLLSCVVGGALGVGVFYALNGIVCGIMGNGMPPLVMHAAGIWITAAEWAGIFVIAVAWSGVMLMRAKLCALVRGSDKAKRMPRFPKSEAVVSAVMLCAIVGLCVFMAVVMYNVLFVWDGSVAATAFTCAAIGGGFLGLMAAIVVFHMGLRSIWLQRVVRREKRCGTPVPAVAGAVVPRTAPQCENYRDRAYKGMNLVRSRGMAAAMDRNAAVMGIVALLMTLAVLLSDFAFSLHHIFLSETERTFDVTGTWYADIRDTNYHIYGTTAEQAVEEAEKFTHVDRVITYDLCWADDALTEELEMFVVAESKAALVLEAFGESVAEVSDGGFYILGNSYVSDFDEEGMPVYESYYDGHIKAGETRVIGGETLVLEGWRNVGVECMDSLGQPYFNDHGVIVVPDGVAAKCGVFAEKLHMNCGYLPAEYDALFTEKDDLYGIDIMPLSNRYKGVDSVNTQFSVILVTCLFLGMTFMLMSMALLSLRIMSDIPAERRRYGILSVLGQTRRACGRSLMYSLAVLLGAPLVLPLLMTIPALAICTMISEFVAGSVSAMLYVIGISVPLVYAAIYGCYFAAAYHISCKAILAPLGGERSKVLMPV